MIDNKIGIIGGSGFVGTRLKKRFRNNKIFYKIFDINTKTNEDIYLDVEDLNSLNQINGLDTIINLAAVHRDDVFPLSRYDDVNVQGAINVCKAARENQIRTIIFTSSVAIYGFAKPETDESGAPNYFNDYGRTKFLAEQVYKEWQCEDKLNRTLVIIRPTVIFGEGNRGNVYNLLRQIASRKFVMFGAGSNKKSMAYVENVAAFLEYSLKFKPGVHIYNYIDKPDLSMNMLVSKVRNTLFKKNNAGIRLPAIFGTFIGYFADLLSKLTGKSFPISSIRVKKFMGTTQFNSSSDKSGFVPPISLNEGLSKTLKYEFIDDNSDKTVFKTE